MTRSCPQQNKAWDGMTAGYNTWTARVHDHVQLCNDGWRRVLDLINMRNMQPDSRTLHTLQIDLHNALALCTLPAGLWALFGNRHG